MCWTGGWAKREPYLADRLFGCAAGNWGNDLEQDGRTLSPEVDVMYPLLKARASPAAEVSQIAAIEVHGRGYLVESLVIQTGKRTAAARALKGTPLP